MQIIVIFNYKDIDDPDSQEADAAVAVITDEIDRANISCDEWWIEDAVSADEESDDEEPVE
jgi:hypothetical protein